MISDSLRTRIRQRAKGFCEYCLCPSSLTSAPFHCEHIHPRSAGGETTLENLAWACPACNHQKHTKTHALDPQTKRQVPLFHPRRQKWKRHFQWGEDSVYIVGRTRIGRATVGALKMNRPEVVSLRKFLQLVGEHPPETE